MEINNSPNQLLDDFIDEISFKIKKGNDELKTSIDSESVDFKRTASIEITEIRRISFHFRDLAGNGKCGQSLQRTFIITPC